VFREVVAKKLPVLSSWLAESIFTFVIDTSVRHKVKAAAPTKTIRVGRREYAILLSLIAQGLTT
jgi:hypothetical protein